MSARVAGDWLASPAVQDVMAMLNRDGEEARIAGGAVRNALQRRPVADVDVATTAVPRDVITRARQAGFKPVPTGIAHGTVTVVAHGEPIEVTTLRRDLETDGRHARVAFGRDWHDDAERRDLTMNALYCDAGGTVFDPVGTGVDDALSGTVRFVGDAAQRIEEDYLRILRFFRFFAWYGKGRPDADGLRACARLKAGLDGLSVERVWHELSRTLAAPDPVRAVLWMRQTGVSSRVLPESEAWGIDGLAPLVRLEAEAGLPPDPVLRLMALVRPERDRVAAMARRLKVANVVRDRLVAWAACPQEACEGGEAALARAFYVHGQRSVLDRLLLTAARTEGADRDRALARIRFAEGWRRPVLPVRGRDLIEAGLEPGPAVSRRLRRLEKRWIDSGFTLDRDALLAAD